MSDPANRKPALELDYRQIFRDSPALLLLLSPDLVVLDATDELLHSTRRSREELVGHLIFDVLPAKAGAPEETAVDSLRASLERVRSEKVPDVIPMQRYDVLSPGGEGAEERYWTPTNVPVLDSEGRLAFIVLKVDDVTAFGHLASGGQSPEVAERMVAGAQEREDRLRDANRHLTELNAELREARDRLDVVSARTRRILESITDAFYAIDLDGRFVYVNQEAARILRRPQEELLGQNVWNAFPEAVGSVFQKEYQRVMDEGRAASFDAYYPPLDTWVCVRAYPNDFGLSVYFLDITERKRAEEEEELLRSLAVSLGEADTLKEAFRLMVDKVCKGMGWPKGEVWTRDQDGQLVLESTCSPEETGGEEHSFASGEEPARRAWAREDVVWWHASQSAASAQAGAAGDQVAVAVPIRAGDSLAAVMVFFRAKELPSDRGRADALKKAAESLGHVLERKRTQSTVQELSRQVHEQERLLSIAGRVARLGGWSVDLESGVATMSDEICRIHALPPGSVLTEEEALSFYSPESRRSIQEHFRRCVEEGVPYEIELEMTRRDGERAWVRTTAEADRDETGRIVGVHGAMQDITEEKRTRAELAAAEALYRRLFESAPYGIYALDEEGRFIEINPAGERLLQRDAEQLIGMHYSQVVSPGDIGIADCGFQQVISGEDDDIEYELRILQASGAERLARVTKSAIREGDQITGTHGIVRDITEEVERGRSLRRAERLASIGTLVAGVAHELSNPLHAIRNFAELMLLEDRSEADREELEIIIREAERASKVVSDLRLSARHTQEEPGRRERVDLNEVVRHVLTLRRYALSTGSVQLTEDLADELSPVQADPGEIEQVLLNLLLNAEHALTMRPADERRLTVRTRPTAGGVSLHVVDNGSGIEPAFLERIFDPFFTTKPPGEGTGLGLALVHKIVDEHGGEIHVDSESGKGTSFRVDLPRAPASATESGGERTRPQQAERALRILVVDDEPAIRLISERSLAAMGHHVQVAADGRAALALLDHNEYDVILSDLRMPGLDGAELFRRLKARGAGWEQRVIFVTGDVTSTQAGSIAAQWGVPVLAKPILMGDLARAVEQSVKLREGRLET